MDKKLIVAGLCGPGRHEMPVQEYIFPSVVENPMDFEALNRQSVNYILNAIKLRNGESVHIRLYITGLTPVLTSFLSMWVQECLDKADDKLTLMHYNRDTGLYVAQDF